jgi:hypothetical protein
MSRADAALKMDGQIQTVLSAQELVELHPVELRA